MVVLLNTSVVTLLALCILFEIRGSASICSVVVAVCSGLTIYFSSATFSRGGYFVFAH